MVKSRTKITLIVAMLAMIMVGAFAGAFLTLANKNTISAKAEMTVGSDDFFMETGAEIRTVDPYGLRFRAYIGSGKYADITAAQEVGTSVVLGMYIFPSAYLDNASAYTGSVGEYNTLKQKKDLIFYSDDSDVNKIFQVEGKSYYKIQGVLSNLVFANYSKSFVAVAYIKTTTGGIDAYEFADFDVGNNARSAAQIANLAYPENAELHGAILNEYIDGAYYAAKGATCAVDGETGVKTYTYGGNEYASVAEIAEADADTITLTAPSSKDVTVFNESPVGAAVKANGVAVEGVSIAYSTDDASVATVDKNGNIVALAEGTATITAHYKDLTFDVDVTVADDRTVTALPAFDYDISKNTAFEAEVSGNVKRITVDGVDVTSACTIDGGDISVSNAAMSDLGAGVKSVVIDTPATKYTLSLTNATYVISDASELDAFFAAKESAGGATSSWYVVFDSDVTVTSNSSRNGNATFSGVIDGRGHTVTGLNAQTKFISQLNGTIKNIAIIDFYTHFWQSSASQCFISILNGTLDNVYLKVRSFNAGGSNNALFAYVYGDAVVRNCIFTTGVTATKMPKYMGTSSYDNNCTVSNVYGIGEERTAEIAAITQYDTLDAFLADSSVTLMGSGWNSAIWVKSASVFKFGEKVLASDAIALSDELYVKSTDTTFTATGFSGTVTALYIDETYIGTSATVAQVTMQALSVGNHTVTIYTDYSGTSLYEVNLTVVESNNVEIAVDYDLSDNVDLSIETLERATSVTYGGNDITSSCSISDNTVTIPRAFVISDIGTGEKSIIINSANSEIDCTVSVITYLIENVTDYQTFILDLLSGSNNSKAYTEDWFVVVNKDFNLNGFYQTEGQYFAGDSKEFAGVLDGRGHVIGNCNIYGSMFGKVSGTIKNIAFKDIKMYNKSASLKQTVIYNLTGTLDNVYLDAMVSAQSSWYKARLIRVIGSGAVISNSVIKTGDMKHSVQLIGETNDAITGLTITDAYFITTANPVYISSIDNGNPVYDNSNRYASAAALLTAISNELPAGFNSDIWSITDGTLKFANVTVS